jgi:hypothetical protein
MARARTHIETPHILEKPFVIAGLIHPSHSVRKGDRVCTKPMSKEHAPYRSLARADGKSDETVEAGQGPARVETWQRWRKATSNSRWH